LLVDGEAKGIAALIDSRGYFLAGGLHGEAFQARLSGQTVHLRRIAGDGPTGLMLFAATDWKGGGAPVKLADTPPARGSVLVALLPSGPIRVALVSSDRYVVIAPSHRLLQLNELKLETPQASIGGGLLFAPNGRFLGVLTATLGSPDPPTGFNPGERSVHFGPELLTVAYAVGQDTLRRVIVGFCSPTHEVGYPSLGVLCRDAPSGGALVETVAKGSTADKVRMQPGDVIVKLGTVPIRNKLEFAKEMMRQVPGEAIRIAILRRGSPLVFAGVVGKSTD
ncbi:MAG: PDZ domain-containing protein, partial [Fimbriimonas ginsengisoli]|nr:PDZ domain-containing protein [Fimbriimonas ginsengisoli]